MIARIFHLVAELGGFGYAVVTITRAVVYWCGGPAITPFSKKEFNEILERHQDLEKK